MMFEGKYVVESIENGLVKLLLTNDESIEEIIKLEQLNLHVKQGDLIILELKNERLVFRPLEDETKKRREQAERLLDQLKIEDK
jgi:hypothetical protein